MSYEGLLQAGSLFTEEGHLADDPSLSSSFRAIHSTGMSGGRYCASQLPERIKGRHGTFYFGRTMHLLFAMKHLVMLSALCAGLFAIVIPMSGAATTKNVRIKLDSGKIKVANLHFFFEYTLNSGLWSVKWVDPGLGIPAMTGVSCSARLSDNSELSLSEYSEHQFSESECADFTDVIGLGTEVTVHHRAAGKPELRQVFRFYPDHAYFLTRVEIVSEEPASSNHITPLLISKSSSATSDIVLESDKPLQVIHVPYDNDNFVRYNDDKAPMSYEVTAVYDNDSRHGFVFGSVNHEIWKTGILLGKPEKRRLSSLQVFGGVSQGLTHSTLSHGTVTGKVIASPFIFVGCFSDWRVGLEAYGKVCGSFQPPLPWNEGVPFGWNSWSAYQASVSAEKYCAVSDFLKESVQSRGFSNRGALYVNLDSFWDNLSEAQILESVRHIKANGQKPGIYWTPFVCWGGDLNRSVEGTNGKYTYHDILLKGPDGKPVPHHDGGMPLDPSHPGTLQRIDWQLNRFVQQGFDYIKLDFLTHGALEGAHFDLKITTGNAAYTLGMKRLIADLDPAKIGRPFFISLSIAPLFPSGLGHSRRFACDTWGELSNVEYMLNSLTYGWWANGTLYRYNDPDHTVLYQKQPYTLEQEGRSRLNASIIGGTVLLDGDDLTDPVAQDRAIRFLTNEEILNLARAGKSFRPIEGDTGCKAADIFVREDRRKHIFYIAVFNYSKASPVTKTLDFARMGLDPSVGYIWRDLWTKRSAPVKSTFSVTLEPAESTILALTRTP